MKTISILCALLGVAVVGAEEVREVVVEKLPWSVTEYVKTLPMEKVSGGIPLRLRHGEQVVEGYVSYEGDGNVAMLVNERWAALRTAVDNGVLYIEPSWGEAQLEDVNGDGFFDLTLRYKDVEWRDDEGHLLKAPVPQWTQMEVFLYNAQHKQLMEAVWSFASHPEGGEAVFPHRLEIQREGEAPVAVWRSFKPPVLLGYVDAGAYAVVFFADPLIRPDGNIILAWRLVAGKAPELVFATPYADDKGVDYKLCDLRVEGGRVLGRITARLTEGHGELPAIPVELNAQTPRMDFRSPLYPHPSGD